LQAFARPVKIRGCIPTLSHAYEYSRTIYIPLMLTRFKLFKHGAEDKRLGVADVELYSNGLDYIYDEADITAGIAALSLYRSHPEFFRGYRSLTYLE
jgi:archaemetzincin